MPINRQKQHSILKRCAEEIIFPGACCLLLLFSHKMYSPVNLLLVSLKYGSSTAPLHSFHVPFLMTEQCLHLEGLAYEFLPELAALTLTQTWLFCTTKMAQHAVRTWDMAP